MKREDLDKLMEKIEQDGNSQFGPSTVDCREIYKEALRYRTVLGLLIAKVKECGEASEGYFAVADLHGCAYSGPNWSQELADAEQLLNSTSPIT